MSMANSVSILDNLLEVVYSFTPDEDVTEFSFNHDGKFGGYMILSLPAGNLANMGIAAPSDKAYISDIQFALDKWAGDYQTIQIRGLVAHVIRPDSASRGYYDYWGMPGSTVDDTTVTIKITTGPYKFYKGITYYVVRVKR